VTPSGETTSDGETSAAAHGQPTDSGSPTTLLAGLGLVGLVGAGAAYLALRRRATS
jgi:LPXTG-motif cell wall-anchored protein